MGRAGSTSSPSSPIAGETHFLLVLGLESPFFCYWLVGDSIQVPQGFPGSSDSKESACNAGDTGSIPGSGRSPGEGNGNPLQCSCPKNPMDRRAWWATVCGVSKNGTRLNNTFTFRSCRQFFASWPPQAVHNLNVFLSAGHLECVSLPVPSVTGGEKTLLLKHSYDEVRPTWIIYL